MSYFFLDSSALTKRYLVETGTPWVDSLTDPSARNTIVVAEITLVEVAAAVAARHRAPGSITLEERDEVVNLLNEHFDAEYQIASLDRAVSLTQNYRLRGYDAVQLATALAADDSLTAADLPGLTFVAADQDLVLAARAEGISADDPNQHTLRGTPSRRHEASVTISVRQYVLRHHRIEALKSGGQAMRCKIS